MKAVLVTPYYTLSMQRKVYCLAQKGMTVRQVIPPTHERQVNPVLQEKVAVPNHTFVPVRLWNPADPHRTLLRSTLAWLRTYQPDVLAVEWDADTLMAAQTACLRNVWSPQTKVVFHSWQNVARPLRLAPRLVLRYTLRQADAICCANREGTALLRQWGYTGPAIYQPWIGIDTSVFYRREASALRTSLGLEGCFVVGYAGRLSPEKGLSDLVRAVARLPDRVHGLLIGAGSEEAELKELAVHEGITARLHVPGRISNEALAEYFSLMDVLVLPSHTTPVWKEQYGRVLLEAMACQVPIVGSNSGAIPEVVGPAGLIYPEGDVDRLVKSLQTLYANPDLAEGYGQAGFARVMTEYTQEAIATRLHEVYQQVIKGNW
jgi:glycosyltransferase involved in cell wall biosynthesis